MIVRVEDRSSGCKVHRLAARFERRPTAFLSAVELDPIDSVTS